MKFNRHESRSMQSTHRTNPPNQMRKSKKNDFKLAANSERFSFLTISFSLQQSSFGIFFSLLLLSAVISGHSQGAKSQSQAQRVINWMKFGHVSIDVFRKQIIRRGLLLLSECVMCAMVVMGQQIGTNVLDRHHNIFARWMCLGGVASSETQYTQNTNTHTHTHSEKLRKSFVEAIFFRFLSFLLLPNKTFSLINNLLK